MSNVNLLAAMFSSTAKIIYCNDHFLGILDHIYPLAQEGLTNALRHADANSIKVILDIQPTAVALEIMEDGIGLPPQAESLPGMGLRLMRYRANALRAHIQVAQRSTRGAHSIFRIEQAAV